MSNSELLQLLKDVRADYVASARDHHGLRKLVRPFDPSRLPLVAAMDSAIAELTEDETQMRTIEEADQKGTL